MVRFLNYMILFVWLTAALMVKFGNDPFLLWPLAILGGLTIIEFLKFVSFGDNLMLLGFLVSLPYMLYITDLPTANDNLFTFLGTIFLAVAIPLVMIFLFFQLAEEPLQG